jgi:hypothetical protein
MIMKTELGSEMTKTQDIIRKSTNMHLTLAIEELRIASFV